MLRLTIALCLIFAAPAAAKPGDLDRTFGTRGRTAFTSGPGYTASGDVAPRADGSLFVAGNGTMDVGEPWTGGATLARLTAGALRSRTFLTVPPPAPYDTDLGTQRLAALPDGRALVAATLRDRCASSPPSRAPSRSTGAAGSCSPAWRSTTTLRSARTSGAATSPWRG